MKLHAGYRHHPMFTAAFMAYPALMCTGGQAAAHHT